MDQGCNQNPGWKSWSELALGTATFEDPLGHAIPRRQRQVAALFAEAAMSLGLKHMLAIKCINGDVPQIRTPHPKSSLV